MKLFPGIAKLSLLAMTLALIPTKVMMAQSSVTFTPGYGILGITCVTATCTNLRGTVQFSVNGLGSELSLLSINWPATPTAYVCTVTEQSWPVGDGSSILQHSVATTTGMNITSTVRLNAETVMQFDYSCQP